MFHYSRRLQHCTTVSVYPSQRAPVIACTCYSVHMPQRVPVRASACNSVHLSQCAPVTECTCHRLHLSQRAPVTECICHSAHLSQRAPVTECTCHNVHLSQSAPVTMCTCQCVPVAGCDFCLFQLLNFSLPEYPDHAADYVNQFQQISIQLAPLAQLYSHFRERSDSPLIDESTLFSLFPVYQPLALLLHILIEPALAQSKKNSTFITYDNN